MATATLVETETTEKTDSTREKPTVSSPLRVAVYLFPPLPQKRAALPDRSGLRPRFPPRPLRYQTLYRRRLLWAPQP